MILRTNECFMSTVSIPTLFSVKLLINYETIKKSVEQTDCIIRGTIHHDKTKCIRIQIY